MDSKVFKAKNKESGVLSATLLAATVNSASVTPVPQHAPGVIVLRPGTAFEEHIYYKTRDAGAGTISGLTRDYTNLNGGTGFDHTNGSSWETLQASEYINNVVDAILEGYQQEQATIAYVGATSFTVLGDVTAFYTAGRILRYNQDNTKIGIVASSSYSGGSGLTTVVTNYGTVPASLTHVEIGIMPKSATNLVALASSVQNSSYIYAADSGGSDAYSITISPSPTAYAAGQVFFFKANTANTGAATLNVNGLGAKALKKNKDEDLEDNDILSGQIYMAVYDGTNFQVQSQTKFTEDYQIVPSVASNNLTIALKDKYGNDFSATNRLKLKIDTTVNILASSVSFTKNAATNWCNLGSSELATKEADLFLYAIQETGASAGLKFGFSRIAHARKMSDFVNTNTSEKYIAGNWINFNASDKVRVIGRFAATLSASAAYNWSVPTYDSANLINEPIYETRWLSWNPSRTVTSGTTPTYTATDVSRYKIKDGVCSIFIHWLNESGGTAGSGANNLLMYLPMTLNSSYFGGDRGTVAIGEWFESAGTICPMVVHAETVADRSCRFKNATTQANLSGNDHSSTQRWISAQGEYEI